jgi:hypothetical protein
MVITTNFAVAVFSPNAWHPARRNMWRLITSFSRIF